MTESRRTELLSSPLDRLITAVLEGRFSVEVNRDAAGLRVRVVVEPRSAS